MWDSFAVGRQRSFLRHLTLAPLPAASYTLALWASLFMKYRVLIILTVLTIHSMGQGIEKIIFTSQQADEPPTKQGRRPKYAIEFLRQGSGDLIASDFYEDRTKRKLKDTISISKERTKKINEWKKLNKRTFSQSDLGLDIATIKQAQNYKLHFDIPTDLTVNVDSFRFCKTHDNLKTISLGGETFTVTLIDKSGQKEEFILEDNVKDDNFNLQDYILCYKLLVDKIPNEVPSYGFFSKSKFTDIVLYYQKTVECEGFYYKEFTDKNPNMTSKDKRMMTGWNFVEYMGQRTKKE